MPYWIFLTLGVVEVFLYSLIYRLNSRNLAGEKVKFVYFNPQDYYESIRAQETGNEKKSNQKRFSTESRDKTFENILGRYIAVAQILIGLAAASISFGGLESQNEGVYVAKLFLACSIAGGVLFCVSVLYFYESYLHELESYLVWKTALVETFGLSCVIWFFIGFGVWAFSLRVRLPEPLNM